MALLSPSSSPSCSQVPELSWSNSSFYIWGNCDPNKGKDLPQVTQGVRGRTRTRTWVSGVLSSCSPAAASLLCLLESISTRLDGLLPLLKPFSTLIVQTTDARRGQLKCLLFMNLVACIVVRGPEILFFFCIGQPDP